MFERSERLLVVRSDVVLSLSCGPCGYRSAHTFLHSDGIVRTSCLNAITPPRVDSRKATKSSKVCHTYWLILTAPFAFGPNSAVHIGTVEALLSRLREHNVNFLSAKSRIADVEADFLGRAISLPDVSPNAEKVSALSKMPKPKHVKQMRSLLGGLSCCRKCLPDLAKQIRLLNILFRQGVTFSFNPEKETIALLNFVTFIDVLCLGASNLKSSQ